MAAAQGSVVLGRDKKACLGDETTARDTLKQNWSKYAASDKNECISMVRTGGPPSYVELLSCVKILRDARNIRNGDPLETGDQITCGCTLAIGVGLVIVSMLDSRGCPVAGGMSHPSTAIPKILPRPGPAAD